jgi:hypothetical protein
MRFRSPPRIEPFSIALGLYLGTLVFRVLPVVSGPESWVRIAGAVAVIVWILSSQRPEPFEWVLDRRLYWAPCIGTIGVLLVVIGTRPAAFLAHVPFWAASIVTGSVVLITGQRRHAKLLRDRNRVHERVDGRSSRWTNLIWSIGGASIGVLAVETATVGPRPVVELLHQLTPVVVGSAIGWTIGALIVNHSNTVELLVLDDALIVDVRGKWGMHPIAWRRVRTVDIDDETLHVRTALWSSSFSCDLSDADRPQETVRAFRTRANCE